MALFSKPTDGSNLHATVSGMDEFVGVFADGWQFAEAARQMGVLHGAPPAFNAAEDAKNTAKQNAERSQAWADSLISHLQDGIDTIQSDYIDHVEDEAATVADPEIKSLIDTYGSEAVANALVDYADANGNLGPDFRIVGHGAERKLALR